MSIIPAVGDRKLRAGIKILIHFLFSLIAKANGQQCNLQIVKIK